MNELSYKLNDRPFGSESNPRDYHPSRPHQRTFTELLASFNRPDGIVILTGEKGIGKTTLVSDLLKQMESSDNLVAFITKPPRKLRELLPTVLNAWRIPVSDEAPNVLFATLQKFLLEQLMQNKKVLLVIDDAERLSKNCFELIRLLSQLRVNNRGVLQIMLIGTSELKTILETDEHQTIKAQIVGTHRMQPLNIADTAEYIKRRIELNGQVDNTNIDDKTVAAIHRLTRGIPATIDRYCDKLFNQDSTREDQLDVHEDVPESTIFGTEKPVNISTQHDDVKTFHETNDEIIASTRPPRKPRKKAPHKPTGNSIDIEKIAFNTPTRNSMSFFNKQTIMTIVTLLAISIVSYFTFSNKSGHLPSAVTTVSHSEVRDGTSEEEAIMDSENEGEIGKYVLDEMPAEFSDNTAEGGSATDLKLLNIQQLLSRSGQTSGGIVDEQSDNNAASNTTEDRTTETLSDAEHETATE